MAFDDEKRSAMEKKDRSRKGAIDEGIKGLVSAINSHPDHYTTSSCAGRIVLLKKSGDNRKDKAGWVFSSHEKADSDDIIEAIEGCDMSSKESLWLKQEGPIIHAACRGLDEAKQLIDSAGKAGFKRASVQSFSRRIIVEILDTERIDMPVVLDERVLFDPSSLRPVILEANRKLEKARERINKLERFF
ncbi:MAG: hypothetical protein R6U32_00140 [Candidatus Woesearchaeota archaeon]